MRNISVVLFAVVIAFLAGCKSKSSATIDQWQQFQDPYFKVTFNYPKGWTVTNEPQKISVYSSEDVMQKFFDHDQRKPDGVQIIVGAEKDSSYDYSKYINAYRDEMQAQQFTVGAVEPAKLEGLDAAQIKFSGNFDEQTKLTTIRVATVKDSMVYYVQYAAFNDAFEPYRVVLDTLLASLTLPRKIVVPKGQDVSLPLTEVQKFSNDILDLDYPANFNATELPKKGDATFAIQFIGYRRDCTVDIDVRPARKLTVEKVADQNEKVIKPTAKGSATVSGEKAITFDYSPAKTVSSRIYFVVKNDNLYRIILNYYSPMKKDFLPAFEKVVASIRLK